MSLKHPTVAFLLQALSVMSLRRPTVASFPYIYLFTFRGVASDTRSVVIYLFTYQVVHKYYHCCMSNILFVTHSCIHWLYLLSELSCEYFQSTHLACWFGQMLMKAISWMKSLIASPTPRGVPVSPVWSWILVTCIIYASATHNKYPRASLRRSKSC